jgi:hypothetical protein
MVLEVLDEVDAPLYASRLEEALALAVPHLAVDPARAALEAMGATSRARDSVMRFALDEQYRQHAPARSNDVEVPVLRERG